jgi:hypothetical protein
MWGNGDMKKLLLLLLAILAARMAARALRRETEVVSLLWTLVGMTAMAGNLANTPKTRSVEDRLNSLVATVGPQAANAFPKTGGTVTGSVVVTGNHQVNGSMAGAGGGTLEVGAGLHSSGTVVADSGLSTSNVSSNGGSTNEFSGPIHTAGNAQVDGQTGTTTLYVSGQRVAPGQGTPGGYPIVSTAPWGPGVVNVINGIIGGCRAAGIFV